MSLKKGTDNQDKKRHLFSPPVKKRKKKKRTKKKNKTTGERRLAKNRTKKKKSANGWWGKVPGRLLPAQELGSATGKSKKNKPMVGEKRRGVFRTTSRREIHKKKIKHLFGFPGGRGKGVVQEKETRLVGNRARLGVKGGGAVRGTFGGKKKRQESWGCKKTCNTRGEGGEVSWVTMGWGHSRREGGGHQGLQDAQAGKKHEGGSAKRNIIVMGYEKTETEEARRVKGGGTRGGREKSPKLLKGSNPKKGDDLHKTNGSANQKGTKMWGKNKEEVGKKKKGRKGPTKTEEKKGGNTPNLGH